MAHLIYSAGSVADVVKKAAPTPGADPPRHRRAVEPAAVRPGRGAGHRAAGRRAGGRRWAATWGHRQPVRFIVGLRGDETFAEITELLKRGNRYAQSAGALILVCIDEGEDERTARYAAVDAGAAIAQLTIEAVSRGLDRPSDGRVRRRRRDARCSASRRACVPSRWSRSGRSATTSNAPPEIVERDAQGRQRLPLDDVAFAGSWGLPLRYDAGTPRKVNGSVVSNCALASPA